MGDLLKTLKKHEQVIETTVTSNDTMYQEPANIQMQNPLLTQEQKNVSNTESNVSVPVGVNLLIQDSAEKTAERTTEKGAQLTADLKEYMRIDSGNYEDARNELMKNSIWFSSKYMANVKSNLKKLDKVMDQALPQNLTELRLMYRENCLMYEEVLFHCKAYLEKRTLTAKASKVQKTRHKLVRTMQHYLNIEYNAMKLREEEICSKAEEAIKTGSLKTWRNLVRDIRCVPEDSLKGKNQTKQPLEKGGAEKIAASRLSLITGQGSLYEKSVLVNEENGTGFDYNVVTQKKYDSNLEDVLKLGEGKVIYSDEVIKKLQTLKVMDFLLGIKRNSGKGIMVKTEPSKLNKDVLIIKDINASFEETEKSNATSFDHDGFSFYDYTMIQGITSLDEAGLNTLLGDVLDKKRIKDIKVRLKEIKHELSGQTGVMPLQDDAEWQARLMAKKERYRPVKDTNGANQKFDYVDMKYYHAGRVRNVLSKAHKSNKKSGLYNANKIANINFNYNFKNPTFKTHMAEIEKDTQNIIQTAKFDFQDRIRKSAYITKDISLFHEIEKLKENKTLNISELKAKMLELAFGNYTDTETLDKLNDMADDPDIKSEDIFKELEKIYTDLKSSKNAGEFIEEMLKKADEYKSELDDDDLDILKQIEAVKGEKEEKKREVLKDIKKKNRISEGLEHQFLLYAKAFCKDVSDADGVSEQEQAYYLEARRIGMIKHALLYLDWAKSNSENVDENVVQLAKKVMQYIPNDWKTKSGDMQGNLKSTKPHSPIENEDKVFDALYKKGAAHIVSHKIYPVDEFKKQNIIERVDIKLVDMSELPLFSKEPSSTDIKQAFVGDCYFQSALSALVSRDSSFIKNHMKDNGKTVTVRFYKKNDAGEVEPFDVEVNKTIPQYYSTHNSGKNKKSLIANDISTRGTNNLWVLMYEKAFIKSALKTCDYDKVSKKLFPQPKDEDEKKLNMATVKNSFLSIEGGDLQEALSALTGIKHESIVEKFLEKDQKKQERQNNNGHQDGKLLTVISASRIKSGFTTVKDKNFNELINKPDTLSESNKEWNKKNDVFYNVLKKSFDKEVEKRFTLRGKTKEGTKRHSVTRNVTKEAVEAILMDFRNWSGGKEYMEVVNLLRKQDLSLKETEVDDILKSFLVQMSKTNWYDELGNNCTNLDEEPHYNKYANDIYADMEKRLEKGVLTCGTYGYHTYHDLDGEEQGAGVNGEYMMIGMAEKHAYVINNVWETENGHKMVTLTNPWGASGLSYVKRKDASGKTIYSIKEQPATEGGIFDLELNDFIRYVQYYT